MSAEVAARSAQLLVPHCLDTSGHIEGSRVQKVIAALREIPLQHKPAILRSLLSQLRTIAQQQQATITSAVALSPATQQAIQRTVSQQHPQIRTFVWAVDSALLGGFTVLVEDTWYDASVRHHLQQIQEQL